MNKYIITIEEVIDEDFVVFAEDAEQAMEIAEEKYESGEFVLEQNNVTFRQMAISQPEDEATEWVEF